MGRRSFARPTTNRTINILLAGEQFSTLHEAQVLIERWRRHCNAVRPHSSLGYRPPAPETSEIAGFET